MAFQIPHVSIYSLQAKLHFESVNSFENRDSVAILTQVIYNFGSTARFVLAWKELQLNTSLIWSNQGSFNLVWSLVLRLQSQPPSQ